MRSLSITARHLIQPDARQVDERVEAAEGADFGSFDVAPADGNLHRADADPPGNEQRFDVESEAVQPLTPEDLSCRPDFKEFEAALRIVIRKARGQPHDQVEEPAGGFAQAALVARDQGAVQRAGANGRLRALRLDGSVQFFDLIDRGGEIRVAEQNPLALGLKHAVTHRIAFAAISRVA